MNVLEKHNITWLKGSIYLLVSAVCLLSGVAWADAAPEMSAPPERCSVALPEDLLLPMSLNVDAHGAYEKPVYNDEMLAEALSRLAEDLGAPGMSCDGLFSCSPALIANADTQGEDAQPKPAGQMCSLDDPTCWLYPEPLCPCSPQLELRSLSIQITRASTAFDSFVVRTPARFLPGDHPAPERGMGMELVQRLERPPRMA